MARRTWFPLHSGAGLKLWKASKSRSKSWMGWITVIAEQENRRLRRSARIEIEAQLEDMRLEFLALLDELDDYFVEEEDYFEQAIVAQEDSYYDDLDDDLYDLYDFWPYSDRETLHTKETQP